MAAVKGWVVYVLPCGLCLGQYLVYQLVRGGGGGGINWQYLVYQQVRGRGGSITWQYVVYQLIQGLGEQYLAVDQLTSRGWWGSTWLYLVDQLISRGWMRGAVPGST